MVSLGYPEAVNDPNDAISAELFRRHRVCRGVGWTTCTYPSAEKLMEKVSRGKWEMEFVEKYPTYGRGWLIECYFRTIRRNAAGWYNTYRCYLSVECRQIRFFWNEVLEERVW